MTVEYIRYELAAHQPEDLVRAYTIAADALRAAPECMMTRKELYRLLRYPESLDSHAEDVWGRQ